MSRRPRVVVLYRWRGPWPLRRWEARRLFAWREVGLFDAVHINAAFPVAAADVRAFAPDLIVYDATALATRQLPEARPAFDRLIADLDDLQAVRIAAPLDEFLANGALNQILDKARIDRIYSPALADVWPDLYGAAARRGIVAPMLTGYVDDGLQRLSTQVSSSPRRPVWLGYRTCEADPRFGPLGALKRDIGLRADEWARLQGLTTDVRAAGQDVKRGSSWLRFLRRTRVTVGVEGGSSVLDDDGALAQVHRTGDQPWVPPHGGKSLNLRALSPRHLEAAACGVAQVLVSGAYSGVLQPDLHYLPVAEDLSDLEDRLDQCRQDAMLVRMTEQARRDLVETDRFTWRRKLSEIRSEMLG